MSQRAVFVVAGGVLVLLALALAAFVAWWLWPVQCDSTAIGWTPPAPDPNTYACTRRMGGTVDADAAELTACAGGAAVGLAFLAVAAGGLAALWRESSADAS